MLAFGLAVLRRPDQVGQSYCGGMTGKPGRWEYISWGMSLAGVYPRLFF